MSMLLSSGALPNLRRPGLAETALVVLGLLCILMPQWRSLSRHREQRQSELRQYLTAAVDQVRANPQPQTIGDITIRVYDFERGWLGPGGCDAAFPKAPVVGLEIDLDGFELCPGKPVVAAWQRIDDLGVLAEIPRPRAYRSYRTMLNATILIGVIAGLSLLLLALAQTSNSEALPKPRKRKNTAAWGILAVALAATVIAWLSVKTKFPSDRTVPLSDDYPMQVFLAGLAISILLFDIALVLSSTRSRALGLAELMAARHRESEARIRAVIDQAPDGIVTVDSMGGIETFNPGAERLFGYSSEEARRHRIAEFLPVCDPKQLQDLSEGSGVECEAIRQDRSTFPVDLTLSRMQLDDRVRYTAIIRDASARKRAEEELRDSQQRYALAAQGANDGLWDWNLETNEVYYSPRWRNMVGDESEALFGSPDEWLGRIHPDDISSFRARLAAHLEDDAPHFECEYRIRNESGSYSWMLSRGLAVRDDDGRATRIAGSQTDISDRKQTEKRLIHQALHDPLTGLHNRSYFLKELERVRREAAIEGGRLFGLLFMDLDRFKLVNDSLGHVVGDQLLVKVAEQLRDCVRPGDVICRLGGDEFALLIDRMNDPQDAAGLARRIQQKLEEPIRVGKQEVFTAVSIGIALSSDGRRSPEEMLRDADTAMYRAKTSGRSRYEVFDQGMHVQAVRLLKIENDLRRAVERDELIVEYQPIVQADNGQVVCCEALMRWQHPDSGLLAPSEFIGVAEDTGIINSLTEWLLDTVCVQLRDWSQEGLPPIRVAVNASPRQLIGPGFRDMVISTAKRHGVSPTSIQLEFTESAFLDTTDTAKATINALSEAGVRISLDDFGTGYSSLVYLHRFPLDVIKIDRSFIGRIPDDRDSAAIAAGLIALAHNLNLEVVGEGVESPEQLRFLVEHECDLVQGFALGRPAEADKMREAVLRGVDINRLLEEVSREVPARVSSVAV